MGSTNSPTSSSSSSCASIASFDDISVKNSTVKFLCSYGGRILPRYPDAKLRYVGGDTRVLSVNRSIAFSDLVTKMGELCGWSPVGLRCQMPTEDMDALVSITSDEDLANLIEEYDLASCVKIRAFLHQSVDSKGKGVSRPTIPQQQQQHRCVHQYSPGSSSTRFAAVGRSGNGSHRIYHHRHHQHPVHHVMTFESFVLVGFIWVTLTSVACSAVVFPV